jgi:division protein CdvB (Snf7/Vps24/ESCRT-III family)
MKFAEKWKDEENIPLHNKIKEKIRPPGSLKPHLESANKRMQIQIRKLKKADNHCSERDKSLFAKTVKAYSEHDTLRAKVYANELSEIRKTKKHINDTKLALEQISLRLGTVSEFGDVVGMLSPTVSILQNIGKGISKSLPDTGKELGQIGDLINGIIMESNQSTGIDLAFDTTNDAAQSILDEAAEVAEQNVKQQLPETPVDKPIIKEKFLAKT